MPSTLPKITIAIPVKNDAKGLEKCLKSIHRQTYPQKKLELIVIDDHSTDNTPLVAKKMGAVVLKNIYTGKTIINTSEVGKKIGLHAATGKYIYILEQDIELRGKNFFQKLVKPLEEDQTISASFTREGVPNKRMSWPTRYISYHPAQCDPIYEFFTPSIESTIISSKNGYYVCEYPPHNFPPFGRMMFRIDLIKKTEIWRWPGFFDLDSVALLVKKGHNKFAYCPSPGIYHFHAKTLHSLVFKRVRNLHAHFFPYQGESHFKWFNTKSRKDVLKIVLWVIYANLIIPATIKGIYKSLKHKDQILLVEPVIALLTTDILIFHFLKDANGRKMISKSLITLLSKNNHHPSPQKRKI
ncbi:hypothetical protein A2415_00370 [candidate division WWE3 bacterium RIFOXYC1_FULL_39_7]|uniref:Glycosyltransferase 2-like domain-containing protein n=1 Tax=candidate division WWE3 bacterium RIFOXYC1_FULL_39_7 TaxID=1802643 RepID=A0A1F4WIA3_UNCKA|nr:MAG: hypothetical protein A2415_00370 [candidate division WWE3 bacterium RIFOXYC1_FULL_39_7]